MFERNKVVIFCGPTASGKTYLAHQFAKKYGGEIINADSMQIYKQIPIITASPETILKEEVPYRLYNFQNIDEEFSVMKYIERSSKIITELLARNKLPIVVGGTGMYINMLVYGYNEIPDIEEAVRTYARKLFEKIGSAEFFNKLKEVDPAVTKVLNQGDTQRIIRAYEIFLQTGKSILYFQAKKNILPLPDIEFKIYLLQPERKFLYELCNKRLKQLFDGGPEKGAIAEIEQVYRQYGELNSSAMKALGVREIISYLKGDISKTTAYELAAAKTRQYAKRQSTWFKGQLPQKEILSFSDIEGYKSILLN